MAIALVAVACLAVATPPFVVWIARSTSRREEVARNVADRHRRYSDAVTLHLWSATVSGDRRPHHRHSVARLH
jgi:hypothetical protein